MIRATLRLQLHRGFTFDHAAQLAPYAASLGVSHLYVSPIFKAVAGSTHGYDTIDYSEVSPELGGEAALRRLGAALRKLGLGLVVDIVPNHMAAHESNPWWRDVLAHGRKSRYAKFFDIDWSGHPGLVNKLLLPILGRPYGEALAAGELVVERERGERTLHYFERRLPIVPASGPLPRDAAELHAMLESQPYRLAWWRAAADELNWRRFFEITGLAGLRVGVRQVFDAVHAKVFELYRDGVIDGVRVDHVDGLSDPRGYCRRLQRALRRQRPGAPWIVVEKVLGANEVLPPDWGIDGSTGYDFMNDVGALLHAGEGAGALTQLWQEISGSPLRFSAHARVARRLLATRNFNTEVQAATRALAALARKDAAARDCTFAALQRALIELLAWFSVYRPEPGGDPAPLQSALRAAAVVLEEPERYALGWIGRWLQDGTRATWRARRRVAQLMAPLAGKAVEDTAFYRYGRLVSRCEVGSDPAQLSLDVAEFHQRCERRARDWPRTLLATATHDHKRGEDARARLAVLSEIPDEWARTVQRWRERHASLRQGGPDATDEYLLYQALVGAWPYAREPLLGRRLVAWQEKALREAKRRSDWLAPDEAYESACRKFLEAVLGDPRFVRELETFVDGISPAAVVNSLTQVLLRLTTPGIPDLYQGCELWDFSLVDPDNRRPVDFAARIAALDRETPLAELLESWRDGRVKQALIARVLALRAAHPGAFAGGSYGALSVQGERREHVVAFERRSGSERFAVIAPLHVAGLAESDAPRIDPEMWGDTEITLPEAPWRDVLGGASVAGGRVRVSDVLTALPFAVLQA